MGQRGRRSAYAEPLWLLNIIWIKKKKKKESHCFCLEKTLLEASPEAGRPYHPFRREVI